jgi:hypothetical protein
MWLKFQVAGAGVLAVHENILKYLGQGKPTRTWIGGESNRYK